jgi:PPM family protein phosphatase
MSVILRTASISDLGKVRDNNEDAVHAGRRLIAVADGVGGGPSGEVASGIAIRSLQELDTDTPTESLADGIARANQRIREAIESRPELEGMGTTLTAMLAAGDELQLAHIGDSRAYLWRDGELVQLSRDDTFVQGLVDNGVISASEARNHPQRSLVTQAMNGAGMDPTFMSVTPRPGDRYLLCSDGLTDYVDTDAIARTFASHPDVDECARHLVDLALAAGAPDNVTVVVASPDM